MNNSERRQELANARRKAVEYAKIADQAYDTSAEDGPEVLLATMWAAVADALKVGVADGPDATPSGDYKVPGFTPLTR